MNYLQKFKTDIAKIELPEKFTFPFYYEPHPLTRIAAKELQEYLTNQKDFVYNFGLGEEGDEYPQGKMFGVMVVKDTNGTLGYLAAYSGTLNSISQSDRFVPPVFDVNAEDSFYVKGEKEVDKLTKEIKSIENDNSYLALQELLKNKIEFADRMLEEEKERIRNRRKERKLKREKGKQELSESEYEDLDKELIQQSNYYQWQFKMLSNKMTEMVSEHEIKLKAYQDKISSLKEKRKKFSNSLQQKIFESYEFLDFNNNRRNLTEIFPFEEGEKPPAGSGDCSAPKLLQYAYLNNLTPIALGEFWWGASPLSEIRKHKHFYHSCNKRCRPILGHMLGGLDVEDDPFINNDFRNKELEIVYEDENLAVINKPHDFLSVPGKNISDSVYSRMHAKYPDATGPLIVHRLDMSTSGLLLIAKSKRSHELLQKQFLEKTISKKYVALLDGIIEKDEGEISLPIRVDLDDRPRQLVDYEYGKEAISKWKVIDRKDGKTLIELYPITGRTHQLRVHMSHPLGLNTPIVGDDLYGTRSDRLYLHAEYIEFEHPFLRERMNFEVDSGF